MGIRPSPHFDVTHGEKLLFLRIFCFRAWHTISFCMYFFFTWTWVYMHTFMLSYMLCYNQGNLKGNLLWRPSCRNIWRWVIVPSDFFIVKPIKQAWVAFPAWTKSRTHIGYCRANHAVTIMCTDSAEWSRQIRRCNNSPPYMTVNMATAP